MTIQYLLGEPDKSFNVVAWNQNNPYFNLIPHPIFLLITGNLTLTGFIFMMLSRFLWPSNETVTTLQYMIVMTLQYIYGDKNPMTKFAVAFGRFVHLKPPVNFAYGVYVLYKIWDFFNFASLFRRSLVFFSKEKLGNLFLWIFNYMAFGIFGTWPLLRPDFVDVYKCFMENYETNGIAHCKY